MNSYSHLNNVDKLIDIFSTAYQENNGLFERDYYHLLNNPLTYQELGELYERNEELYYDYLDTYFCGHPIDLIQYMAEMNTHDMIGYVTTLVELLTTHNGYPHSFTTTDEKFELVFKYKTTLVAYPQLHSQLGVSHIIRCEKDSFVLEITPYGSVYVKVFQGDDDDLN